MFYALMLHLCKILTAAVCVIYTYICKVAVAARRLDRLDALVTELKAGGVAGVCAVRMDVRDETSIKAGVKEVSWSHVHAHQTNYSRYSLS